MMSRDDLTCKEVVELVTEYLEGALPAAQRRRFEEHLAACPGCTIYLQQMRQTVRTLGRLREESLSPEARQQLLRVFQTWKSER